MTRIVFLDPAEREMQEAETYYESQAPGLGQDFLGEVQNAVNQIAQNPRASQTVRSDIRRRLVRRFPFGILYRIDPREIVIIAVMHLRRRPGYWQDRIIE